MSTFLSFGRFLLHLCQVSTITSDDKDQPMEKYVILHSVCQEVLYLEKKQKQKQKADSTKINRES